MNKSRSEHYFTEAKKYIPGGVNSPVRAFRSVNDTPFFVKSAKKSYIQDVDDNRYLDYVASWGAIILGHADEGLAGAVIAAIHNGTSFGACHPHEFELAEIIIGAFPSVAEIRLTSSGTEATMSAIRLARGFTGKNGIIKFRGCYHGHVDSLLVKAGSGLATFGIPDSAGIPVDFAKHTYVAEFNDIDSVLSIVVDSDDIACVIVEPVMGNMGVILPEGHFLPDLAEICKKKEILLIFDEVISGFRVTYGGAQHIYGIVPDITCLGKIIGGGFPIGAFGGRREIMERLAPAGDVYQAGTLSGNPVAVRAGIYVLNYLKNNRDAYGRMKSTGESLKEEVIGLARKYGIDYSINAVTGMFTGFFTCNDVHRYDEALMSDRALYEAFFKAMLARGIFFAPSPFEASFFTLSYGQKEFDMTVNAYDEVFHALKH